MAQLREPNVNVRIFKSKKGLDGSNALTEVDAELDFEGTGALEPPCNPEALISIFEHSDALRPNIDSYVTNIDSFGHRFEPVIDLESDDAEDAVRVSMMLERERRVLDEGSDVPDVSDLMPTDAEVATRIEELRLAMLIERARAAAWFDNAVQGMSFTELRRRTRFDLEVTGNAYWEVLRDADGKPRELVYLPSFTVRLLRKDSVATEALIPKRTSGLDIEKLPNTRKFRRFVQVHYGNTIFFKEFHDSRVISSKTGNIYRDYAELQREEGSPGVVVPQATEVIHFSIFSPRSSYGIPRWIGSLLATLGNRKAGEVNELYFDNKSVPPLAILVSGGKLNDDSVERLESYITEELHGVENFHKILVIESEGQDTGTAFESSGNMKVALESLTSAQQHDAQFLKYMERNTDEVGAAFRNPRLLRGDIRDFNRGTAEAALDFTEAQVFAPERNEFDFSLNNNLLLEIGIKLIKFRSNGPIRANPKELAEMIKSLVDVLPVGVALDLAEGVFGRNFSDVTADWAKRPLKLTLQALSKGLIELDDYEPDSDEETPETDEETPETDGVGEAENIGAQPQKRAPRKRQTWNNLARDIKKLILLREELNSLEADEYRQELKKNMAERCL